MPKKIISLDELSRFKEKFDIELDKKANVDGNYPTLTSGLADNLTPYSEDSGAEQENPFISNGTGTNNNTKIVTVGDYGLLKEKQGNSVVVNQLNNNNQNSSNLGGITYTKNSDGSWTLTGTATTGANKVIGYVLLENVIIGHKYIIFGSPVGSQQSAYSCYIDYWGHCNNTIITSSVNRQIPVKLAVADGYAISGSVTFNIKIVDLTQMFNGNIPQDLLDNPSHFSWYYNGTVAYNTGTLVNANGVKLVSTGRQLWDEQWELGNINDTTGAKEDTTAKVIRSSNYTRVIPNKTYYIFGSATNYGGIYIYYYDINKNFIGRATYNSAYNVRNQIITTPSNCVFIMIKAQNTISVDRKYYNDITISLYYTPAQGGEGYDKYYPYEQPYVVDTGTMVKPYSAGNVRNVKKPSGLEIDYVGSYTFTGNEIWTSSGNMYAIQSLGSVAKAPSASTDVGNIISDFAVAKSGSSLYSTEQSGVGIRSDGLIGVGKTDYDNRVNLVGKTIYYELANPTTEQGTPFAENLPINDYGMLYWLDENDNLVGIPQGAKIFYPTNYKGFVDDMYSRVGGDSSKFVIDSELNASETQRDTIDTQLKNAIGGTLRQLLASSQSIDFLNTAFKDLSECDWTASSTTLFHSSSLNGQVKAQTGAKALCTIYKTVSDTSSLVGDTILVAQSFAQAGVTSIVVKTAVAYTDATTFKAAMKGVLLAYEKA